MSSLRGHYFRVRAALLGAAPERRNRQLRRCTARTAVPKLWATSPCQAGRETVEQPYSRRGKAGCWKRRAVWLWWFCLRPGCQRFPPSPFGSHFATGP